MAGCGTLIEVTTPTEYSAKVISVRCGNTSPYGTPWFCEECEKINAGRNWRLEAEEVGEQWDDDY